jgi:hypothetical protein
MKRILFIVLFISIAMSNVWGLFKIGVRAGVTSSSISASDITVPNEYTIETLNNSKVGLQIGLMSQIKLGGLFIQPEVLIATSGGEVRVNDLVNNTSVVKDQKFTKIDIPVLVGIKMGPLRLGIGPVASMVLKSKSELTDIDKFDDKFKSATFGYQAGVGLDIWKIALDLKYEGNLSRLGDQVTISGKNYSFDSRGHQIIFGVGFLF